VYEKDINIQKMMEKDQIKREDMKRIKRIKMKEWGLEVDNEDIEELK
jgi:hypothetical protein